MRAARECGITFLDDARYNDETGGRRSRLAIPKLFSASCFAPRVGNATRSWSPTSFGGSSGRSSRPLMSWTGRLAEWDSTTSTSVYSWVAPDGPSVEGIVSAVGELIAAGKLRAWGTGNWNPADHAMAGGSRGGRGVPRAVRGSASLQPQRS